MWEEHSLAMKPPEFAHPFLFLHNATGFGIQNRLSVRILLGFDDPLRPLHTILLDLDMKLAGRVAISSRITSNHQGVMYFLHVSKQHMGYKVRPLNLL